MEDDYWINNYLPPEDEECTKEEEKYIPRSLTQKDWFLSNHPKYTLLYYRCKDIRLKHMHHIRSRVINDRLSYLGTQPDIEIRWEK